MTEVLDPLWIPLPDGTRLAARVWLPERRPGETVPAILEAIPYRRRDGTLAIDEPRFAWWAERGLAGVRVDLRGTGDSEGLIGDEYLRQEQDDDVAVIDWLSRQPWCNGSVGMIGYSWGGFAGLQVAARRPPALGAVVTVNSAVRRYTDDCHYTGGCVNAHDMLSWATTMLAFDARPPDPAVVGEAWRERWRQRLDVAPPMIERWLSHQLEDDYWRHGSVAFDYGAIECPVLAAGGWSDPYRNAVLDLLAGLGSPCFGIIGPWAHGYPHATAPGPQMAFLDECARFFGRYLRGDDNAYERTPPLRVYLQSFDTPRAVQERRSGRWLSVPEWPAPARTLTLRLGDRVLTTGEGEPAPAAGPLLRVASAQLNGLAAGHWCPYGGPTQPLDQRADDALSLCFDSPALLEPVDVLGFPMLRLRLAADRERAFVAARLCDIAPDGHSLLVTRGVLNLTHRHGHGRREPLEPGEEVAVELRLDCAGHRFERGHRIRLALSPTYWPWIWPSARPATLTVPAGGGRLELPELGPHAPADLGEPEAVAGVREDWSRRVPPDMRILHDLTAGTVRLLSPPDSDSGSRRVPALDLEIENWGGNEYVIAEDAPLTAEVLCTRGHSLRRAGWDVRIEVAARMRSDGERFLVHTTLSAFEGGTLTATRAFDAAVARFD